MHNQLQIVVKNRYFEDKDDFHEFSWFSKHLLRKPMDSLRKILKFHQKLLMGLTILNTVSRVFNYIARTAP